MGERGDQLAADFAVANQEAVAFAGSCSDAHWHAIVPEEGWSVGVVLHHIAEGHDTAHRFLEAMAHGDGVPDSAENIDDNNRDHAARASGVTQSETVSLLSENGARLETLLRGFDDDELDRTAPFGPAGGQALPVAAMAAVTARHTREHLGHARAAIDG